MKTSVEVEGHGHWVPTVTVYKKNKSRSVRTSSPRRETDFDPCSTIGDLDLSINCLPNSNSN